MALPPELEHLVLEKMALSVLSGIDPYIYVLLFLSLFIHQSTTRFKK